MPARDNTNIIETDNDSIRTRIATSNMWDITYAEPVVIKLSSCDFRVEPKQLKVSWTALAETQLSEELRLDTEERLLSKWPWIQNYSDKLYKDTMFYGEGSFETRKELTTKEKYEIEELDI